MEKFQSIINELLIVGFVILFLFFIFRIGEIICLYKCMYKYGNTINEKIDFLFKKYGDIFTLFYELSLFSTFMISFFFLFYLKYNLPKYSDLNVRTLIFFSFIFVILLLIFFIHKLYPHINKTENYVEINKLYGNEIICYKMFFEGYKNKPERVPLLFLTINTNHPFSYYEFKLLHDLLVMLRCIYSDLKTIFWFPEIIFIILLTTIFIDSSPKFLILLIILILFSVFIFRIYILKLLFSYFNKPIKIIISSPEGMIIDLIVEKKLKRILSIVDKDGIKLHGLKLLKEFLPILGK